MSKEDAFREELALQFILTYTYPHGVKKDVTVRYVVVRQQKRGQKTVPDLKEGVVTRGEFKMNFKPACRVGARVTFRIKEPGPTCCVSRRSTPTAIMSTSQPSTCRWTRRRSWTNP
jgi:hypothetical protein